MKPLIGNPDCRYCHGTGQVQGFERNQIVMRPCVCAKFDKDEQMALDLPPPPKRAPY